MARRFRTWQMSIEPRTLLSPCSFILSLLKNSLVCPLKSNPPFAEIEIEMKTMFLMLICSFRRCFRRRSSSAISKAKTGERMDMVALDSRVIREGSRSSADSLSSSSSGSSFYSSSSDDRSQQILFFHPGGSPEMKKFRLKRSLLTRFVSLIDPSIDQIIKSKISQKRRKKKKKASRSHRSS